MLSRWIKASALFICISCITPLAQGQTDPSASQILSTTEVKGGLIVHLGCGDGKLTSSLLANKSYLVQGLDADVKNIELARKNIQAAGLYGKVSVQQLYGNHLPYTNNLVNLLISENPGNISMDEIMRVLAPLGVAYIKTNGQWTKTVKPWPKDIDEWPQHYHDAANNAVAHDTVAGPPRHYQWLSVPQWSRSHDTLPAVNNMVSSKGRLFTVEDEVSAELVALPGKYSLVARDAFNGIILWKVPVPHWQNINIGLVKHTPTQLLRRLVAIGDTVYFTPGLTAPVVAYDAATGKALKTFKGTEHTQEIVYDQGILFLLIGAPAENATSSPLSSAIPLSAYPTPEAKGDSSIVAFQAESGQKMWEKSGKDTSGYLAGSLSVHGQYVAYCTSSDIVCLNVIGAQILWRKPTGLDVGPKNKGGTTVSLVLSDTTAFLGDSNSLKAFLLTNGNLLWSNNATIRNPYKAPDIFLTSGLVWTGTMNGYDPQTGKSMKTLDWELASTKSHTFCYRNRITDNFYLHSMSAGCDFIKLDTNTPFKNAWVRGTCGIGPLPCNGLLYATPVACSCSVGMQLHGFNALAPEPGLKTQGQPVPVERRVQLEKGSAYSEISNLKSQISDSDWPVYRHDNERSGVSKAKAPAQLNKKWEGKVTTRPSAPTIAAGKVFLADIDAHAVCALDASSGKELWKYTTGARIDSPPTYYNGLLLFGSHDGWAYCLRATDGALVWRFKDLPDRMIGAFDQLESAWPVMGSVIVKEDAAKGPIVYFAAGRQSFLDGGIFVYGLHAQTGAMIYQQHVYGPYTEAGEPANGFKNDIFVSTEKALYLRQQTFDNDLSISGSKEPHIICSAGFLETIPHHRSFWAIDTVVRYVGESYTNGPSIGDIMIKDGNQFYEVRGYVPNSKAAFDPWPNGYSLYAGTYTPPPPTPATEKSKKKEKSGRGGGGAMGTGVERWNTNIPLTGHAMTLANETLFVAGTPVAFPKDDLGQAYEGRMGGVLWAASSTTGKKVTDLKLDAPPVWDGMAVANGQLFISLKDGRILCMGD